MRNDIVSEKEVHPQEVLTLLYSHSLRSIPFNIALATFLAAELFYNGVHFSLVGGWYLTILTISVFRWIYSKYQLSQRIHVSRVKIQIYKFMFLTFLMGSAWGIAYFLFIPHISLMGEFVILLVLAGMSAGAIASLSSYLPAYYAYILPMFLPITIYNLFLFDFDRFIMASMFLLFILMLMVTAKLNSGLLLQNLQLGREKDWLIKQLSQTNTSLEKSNEKLLESVEEVRIMSITDALTGLYNRRHFNNTLKHELERARRNKHVVNLIFIDLDNFKYVNDTFGHPYGDGFLEKVGNYIKHSFRRANDTVFRLGGDEFAAILVNISAEEAKMVCQEMHKQFSTEMENEKVTMSMGIISIPHDSDIQVEDIISRTDKLLYEAKRQGKNQIVLLKPDFY